MVFLCACFVSRITAKAKVVTTASCSKWPSISPQEKNVEDSGLWAH